MDGEISEYKMRMNEITKNYKFCNFTLPEKLFFYTIYTMDVIQYI
jgi:hypothetical protein